MIEEMWPTINLSLRPRRHHHHHHHHYPSPSQPPSSSSSSSLNSNQNSNYFVILCLSLFITIIMSLIDPGTSYKYSNNHQIGSSSRNRHQMRPYPTRSAPQSSNGSYSPSASASSSSSSSLSSSSSSIPSSSPNKVHGTVNCILAIFGEIGWCNQTYHQSLTHIIVKGYRKESRVYKRQYCCGYWHRERCIFNAAQRKCDHETYEKLKIEDTSAIVDQQQRFSIINCDEYEQNSPICAAAVVPGGFNNWILLLTILPMVLHVWTFFPDLIWIQ